MRTAFALPLIFFLVSFPAIGDEVNSPEAIARKVFVYPKLEETPGIRPLNESTLAALEPLFTAERGAQMRTFVDSLIRLRPKWEKFDRKMTALSSKREYSKIPTRYADDSIVYGIWTKVTDPLTDWDCYPATVKIGKPERLSATSAQISVTGIFSYAANGRPKHYEVATLDLIRSQESDPWKIAEITFRIHNPRDPINQPYLLSTGLAFGTQQLRSIKTK